MLLLYLYLNKVLSIPLLHIQTFSNSSVGDYLYLHVDIHNCTRYLLSLSIVNQNLSPNLFGFEDINCMNGHQTLLGNNCLSTVICNHDLQEDAEFLIYLLETLKNKANLFQIIKYDSLKMKDHLFSII